ncbi:hypothetical protein PVAND_016215 [Polypedilum vanderplanki]|uniref:Uncharacterized protein n=1 Tax=Polypedilum vanderplanki TaxID=319348 RepID=A0A9J6BEG2_POLVA|nr:hypothetical protein PVAND_016215 [Polypedilum vanderplanki]
MLKVTIKKFFSESSVHGFQYLTKEKVHLIEKIFWFIAIIFSCICSGILIYQIGVKVQEDLTVTYTSDIAVSVTDIPFPAITYCFELDQMTWDKNFSVIKQNLLNNNFPLTNLTMKDLKVLQAISLVISDNFLNKLNESLPEISTKNLIKLIKHRSIDFDDLIVRPEFGSLWGVHFAYILGPDGFCQNFNIVPSEKLYKNLHEKSGHFNYTRNFYQNSRIQRFDSAPRDPIYHNVTYPMHVPIHDGMLSLFLSHWFNDRKSTMTGHVDKIKEYLFRTPKIFIHNPFEVYTKESLKFFSNWRQRLNFYIEPKQTLIDETLMNYSPDIRQCYFQNQSEDDTSKNERTLRFFQVYTKANCRHECEINKTLETCGCVQFFMIHENSTRICNISDFNCYNRIETEMKSKDECKCYPYCGEIVYNVQRTVTDIVKKRKFSLKNPFTSVIYLRRDNYHSYTHVGFREPYFYPYILKRQFTELDFVSYIGGALGLFLGFSILSFVEIFYYFTIRIAFEFIRSKKKVSNMAITENSRKENELNFYLANSSIHGMNQIGMQNRNILEKILWFVFLISAIPFPAITINHEIMINSRLVTAFYYEPHKTERFIKTKEFLWATPPAVLCDFETIINLFPENRTKQIKNWVQMLDNYYTYKKWFINQTATWKRNFKPEFLRVLTRRGFGFAFNMLEPTKLFRESVSLDFLKIRNLTVKNPSNLTHNTMQYQNYPISGTSRDKFKITLVNNKQALYYDLCKPLKFSVHSPYELPADDLDSTTSQSAISQFYYGQDLEIIITPEVIKTDPELKAFDYKRRNCYFDDERKLTMFKIYTRQNCIQECFSNFLLQHNQTKCIGFYQIRNETNLICHYSLIRTVQFLFKEFSLERNLLWKNVQGEIPYLKTCECLDRCDEVKYNIEIIERRFKNKSEIDTVKLDFYFRDETFLALIRRRSITFDEFLGQAGGLLGLFAGISFLSILELFYFISLRKITNIIKFLKNV